MAVRPDRIRVFAPAKINFLLHVTGKRPDGYHELQSFVVFAETGDVLSFAPAPEFSLSIEGPFAASLPSGRDNLVLEAARMLGDRLGVRQGGRITLVKNLPVASGIGGGSADAAAALRGLLALWGRSSAEIPDLTDITARLGSDVPVCVTSAAAWMEGRGETVTPLPALPDVSLVLVNPGVSIATADVFRKLARKDNPKTEMPSGSFAFLGEIVTWLAATRNDLEGPAEEIAPVIGDVLDSLRGAGAAFTRMSGSGATCFGLFENRPDAERASAVLAKSHPDWWIRATRLALPELARPVRQ